MTTSLRQRTFFLKTRRGKVLRIVREHYMRDDIHAGSEALDTSISDKTNDGASRTQSVLLSASPFKNRYLLLDTNVVLHQMDLLELSIPPLCDVIVLQTVMQEVKHRDVGLYNRLHAIIRDDSRRFYVFANEHHRGTFRTRKSTESANDYNDRLIRVATAWYRDQLQHTDVGVTLLTNDRANLAIAKQNGLTAQTIHRYCAEISEKFPEALERLAPETAVAVADPGGQPSLPLGLVFPKYVNTAALATGLRTGKFLQGIFSQNKRNWRSGYVTVRMPKKSPEGGDAAKKGPTKGKDPPGEDKSAKKAKTQSVRVELDGRQHINRAVHGDIVAIELVHEGGAGGGEKPAQSTRKQKHRGRVVGVIKRNWKAYCGTLTPARGVAPGSRALFVPKDERVPRISISTRQRHTLEGQWIVVAIDEWGPHSRYPRGHYVKAIGKVGDKGAESAVILFENDIPTAPFSKQVLSCLPPADWAITAQNSIGREDLRHLVVCSIDPPGCKDIDDALHVRVLPNGRYEAGVHIADVTYFLRPHSPMDLEAANRATTTYIVEKRLDMLPSLLTTDLCSLRAKVDRFVFSVIWDIELIFAEGKDKPPTDYRIVGTRFGKSIVHSRAALAYSEAQAMLDDPSMTGPLPTNVRNLHRIAALLKRRRIKNGALHLSSPEVRFEVDKETADPLELVVSKSDEAHSLVEEFMLLANSSVARRIAAFFPSCAILRCHPPPQTDRFQDLQTALSRHGLALRVDSSKELADSLDEATSSAYPLLNRTTRILATRCMNQALYFGCGEKTSAEYVHYGLGLDMYTHFTSPIRRYADVVAHRMLASSLGIASLPDMYRLKENMRDLCDNINKRHFAAQMAGRESVALYSHFYFQKRLQEHGAEAGLFEGVVLKVVASGIVVLVMSCGVEQFIRLNKTTKGADDDRAKTDTGDSDWLFDEGKLTLTNRRSQKELFVFQRVRVRVEVCPARRGGGRDELALVLLEVLGPAKAHSPRKRTGNKANTPTDTPQKKRKKKSV